MFFASDLDRTLIYSDKFLEEANSLYDLVEVYEGKNISYMSTKAMLLLRELHAKMPIVPITTRNRMQYERIRVFQEVIQPELYVVNNGGTIIYKGKEDEVWQQHIKTEIEKLSVGYEEALELFLRAYHKPIKRYYKSDDLIWLIIGERGNIDEEAVELVKQTLDCQGWDILVNGKKIYLLPKSVNKWAAAKYIEENYYKGPVIAAGDSIFDYELVHEAWCGIVPKDAYIELSCKEDVIITFQKGLGAAEDILCYALDKMQSHELEGLIEIE